MWMWQIDLTTDEMIIQENLLFHDGHIVCSEKRGHMKIHLTLIALILSFSISILAQEDFTIEDTGENQTYEESMTYPEPAQEQEEMQFQAGEERDWSLASEEMAPEDYQE